MESNLKFSEYCASLRLSVLFISNVYTHSLTHTHWTPNNHTKYIVVEFLRVAHSAFNSRGVFIVEIQNFPTLISTNRLCVVERVAETSCFSNLLCHLYRGVVLFSQNSLAVTANNFLFPMLSILYRFFRFLVVAVDDDGDCYFASRFSYCCRQSESFAVRLLKVFRICDGVFLREHFQRLTKIIIKNLLLNHLSAIAVHKEMPDKF